MTFSNSFKIAVWLVALVVSTFGLSMSLVNLWNGEATPFQYVNFFLWLVLLLSPVYSEIDFFGIRFKREIESAKKEIKEVLFSIRNDVQNSIALNSNQNFYFGDRPSDQDLESAKKKFEEVRKEVKADLDELLQVGERNNLLFKLRVTLESELKRLATKNGFDIDRRKPFFVLANKLAEVGAIPQEMVPAIRELYIICSFGVHGEAVPDSQMAFIEDVAPQVLATLRTKE